MLLVCPDWSRGREIWRAKARDRRYKALVNSQEDLQRMVKWVISEKFLAQFSLAEETERWIEGREAAAAVRGGGGGGGGRGESSG